MAGMVPDYSLEQDFQSKYHSVDKLQKELSVISQLIESLKNTKLKSDKKKKKELIARKQLKLDELQCLGRDAGCITMLGGMTGICLSGLEIIADFFFIYSQLCSNGRGQGRVDRDDFMALYKKIMALMESKEGVKRLRNQDQILGVLNHIGLSESDYKPALEKWLAEFFEDDSLINKTAAGSVYTINKISDRFFYLCHSKFHVSLVYIRGELETIINRDLSSLLTENYQWFGLYVFVVYKILDRLLSPLSKFKDCDEFENIIRLHSFENPNDANIMEQVEGFSDQATDLQEESNNILQQIPHKLSFAKGLKRLQEMSQDCSSFIASLSSFVRESPWNKKRRLFLGVSERNIMSLLDMMRQKIVLIGEASLVDRDDFMLPEWSKEYLSYYDKPIKESIHSLFVFEEFVGETRDLQIFLDYLSCDKLHQVVSFGLAHLFFVIQQIAVLQNRLVRFKDYLLVKKIPSMEENFFIFITEKEKELATIEDKNELFLDSFLFYYSIKDTIPFLSIEKRKLIDNLREKWKNKCDLLEKERINDQKKQSKNPNNEIGGVPFYEPIQKSILLAELLPRLKERLRELSVNILISLVCIEERAYDYKKTNKLFDRFKSASGQVYAVIWYLKEFLNIKTEVTMAALLPKIIAWVEAEDKENQNGLEIALFKKEVARCSESIQSMLDKVKELKNKLIGLKQEKEVLIRGKTDENFSFATIKKMAKIVESYKHLKDQFLFLYDLMRIVSVDDQLQRECLELNSFYELLDDLDAFKETYRTLDKHRYLLCNVADDRETVVRKAQESATKQDDPIEEKQPISREENALETELSHETSADHDINQPLHDGFENWKNQLEVDVNQVTSAIMNASDELLVRLHPLFVRILKCYQQKIVVKQSEYLEELSCIEMAKLYGEQAFFKIGQWFNYMDCRLYYFSCGYPVGSGVVEANNRPYLFFKNNDDVASANMADYLVATMHVSDLEKKIAAEEKRLFNHSQSFIKPLCQNDSVYADGFAGLDKRVFEASEQMFKISQLKRRLGFEKEKKQAVFEQLAKKMDEQSLKSFVSRVDPQANFAFVSTPGVVYLPVGTSASFYQLPPPSPSSVSVADSGYSSHAHSVGGAPPP